jgi:hypothetical protein
MILCAISGKPSFFTNGKTVAALLVQALMVV